MQKVYLLLRDNKQSGPYSLDEIVQLGLRPFDLIWVEGRSGGWSYPSEITALKPYVPEVQTSVQPKSTESMPSTPPTYSPADTATSSSPKEMAPPKSVYISMPGKGAQASVPKKEVPPKETPPTNDWDRRVEEVRQRAQTYAPPKEVEEDIPSLNTHYARSLDEVEEEYTSWVYQQKAKKKPAFSGRQVAALAIGVLLLGGGYWVYSSGNDTPKVTEKPLVTGGQVHQEEMLLPDAEEASSPLPYDESTPLSSQTTSTATSPKGVKKASKPLTTRMVAQTPQKQSEGPVQGQVAQQTVPVGPGVAEPVEEEAVASAPQEKKKTLADKIDGFIEKIASKGPGKTQKDEVEEAPPAGPAPGSGERQSTRRGEEGALAPDRAELARQVDVVANNSDNWMMGVKNLKLTVRNYNSVPLKSATVEVSYFSESDDLLEKKTVMVSNIPAKGRKTVAAPDQRMADHVELKVVSVSADEEAYAQQ
ncbi:MAG TPA: hypothetical protein VGE66_07970 [Chitinophagaceae bacterium]